jgi:hypothetical protein
LLCQLSFDPVGGDPSTANCGRIITQKSLATDYTDQFVKICGWRESSSLDANKWG